jgi:hypothetical protein
VKRQMVKKGRKERNLPDSSLQTAKERECVEKIDKKQIFQKL